MQEYVKVELFRNNVLFFFNYAIKTICAKKAFTWWQNGADLWRRCVVQGSALCSNCLCYFVLSKWNCLQVFKGGTEKRAMLPDKLNTFYARFDRDNTTTPPLTQLMQRRHSVWQYMMSAGNLIGWRNTQGSGSRRDSTPPSHDIIILPTTVSLG